MENSDRPLHSIEASTYFSSVFEPGTHWSLQVGRIAPLRGDYTKVELELVMPTSWDRTRWQPADEIVVTSDPWYGAEDDAIGIEQSDFLDFPLRDIYSVGFRSDGSEIWFLPIERLPYPLLVIRQISSSIGRTDTTGRVPQEGQFPIEGQPGISSPAEEYGIGATRFALSDIDRGTWAGKKALRTLSDCTNFDSTDLDADHDGMIDRCEQDLAEAFRPRLMLDKDEKHADHEVFWEVRRPGEGESPLDVQTPGIRESYKKELWILYALGYHYDAGRWGISWHEGDSEFIVASAEPVNGTEYDSWWTLTRICYAAHWSTAKEFHKCYDAFDPELTYDDGMGGRPHVWVAYKKHGSYPSIELCNSKKLFLFVRERCGNRPSDVAIQDSNKLGKYNPTRSWKLEAPGRYRTAPEKLWNAQGFCGWYRHRDICAGNYLRTLKAWKFAADTASGIPFQ